MNRSAESKTAINPAARIQRIPTNGIRIIDILLIDLSVTLTAVRKTLTSAKGLISLNQTITHVTPQNVRVSAIYGKYVLNGMKL